MTWNGYTVFSVISGIILIIAGFAASGKSVKSRIYAFLGGAFFLGYGIYVAKQATGTYYFPIWIFVIPVVAVGYLIAAAIGKTRQRPVGQARGAAGAMSSQGPGPVPPVPYGPGPGPAPQYGPGPGPAPQYGPGPGPAPQYGHGPVAPPAGQVPPERPAAWPPQPPLRSSGGQYPPGF